MSYVCHISSNYQVVQLTYDWKFLIWLKSVQPYFDRFTSLKSYFLSSWTFLLIIGRPDFEFLTAHIKFYSHNWRVGKWISTTRWELRTVPYVLKVVTYLLCTKTWAAYVVLDIYICSIFKHVRYKYSIKKKSTDI